MENLHDRSTRSSRQPWSPKRMLAAGILTFGLAFGIGSVGTIGNLVQPDNVAAQDTTQQNNQTTAQDKSVADVYAAANPAVVTITTFVDSSTLQQAQGPAGSGHAGAATSRPGTDSVR